MKSKKIWSAILLVIIIAAVAGVIIYNSTDTAKFRKQLDLGHKYLSEMNYEEAVVAFNQAIEIDPRNADAYLGLADAYLGLGDEEAALAALQAGYEATGDERLKERIDEMESAEDGTEIVEAVEENTWLDARMQEIDDLIYGQGGMNSFTSDGSSWLLSYEQIEAAYRPLAEELEGYLEQEPGGWEGGLWQRLSAIYLHLGEMDKCLEARRKGYEVTGWNGLIPEVHEDEDGDTYDEYGREISNSEGWTFTYGDSDSCLTITYYDDNSHSIQTQYEYDDSGRIVRVSVSSDNPDFIAGPGFAYNYQGDYAVILSGGANDTLITYDEYGVHLSRADMSEAQ